MEILSAVRPAWARVKAMWMPLASSALVSVMAAAAAATPARSATAYSEDAVKAAYLYRFTQYVEWPESAPAGTAFTIAVMGSPAVAAELRRLLPNHTIKNATAQVREISRVQDLGPAQMLYIGTPQTERVREAISVIAARPVLVVTDAEHGLLMGSVLNFVRLEHRVRFEVSLTAADRSQLRISAELLGVATRVQSAEHHSELAKAPANAAGE
jgi:YfiR/HmsC-like